MGFHRASWRGRPKVAVAEPGNRRSNTSPVVQACVPAPLFERVADEAARRGVPLSQLVREALAMRFPEGETTR